MAQPFFSIVIPVYNREWSIRRAVDSAVNFDSSGLPLEIVLVDDGSTDRSVRIIEELLEENTTVGNISFKFVRHSTNKGVCGAKNSGARAASGAWVVFLDSDDELIPGKAAEVREALLSNSSCPLHFFKCVDEHAAFTNSLNIVELRDFASYFKNGTNGEALPIVNRAIFLQYPYDEDINGYESLSYLRIVRDHSCAAINSLIVRRYYTSHESRLSSKKGMARRYRDLALGHRRVLREHGTLLGTTAYLKQCLRFLKYAMLSRSF